MAVLTHKPHIVYTRSSWSDAWAAVPYLYANQFTIACGPNTSEATLEYGYGRKMRHGANTFADYTPIDIVDKYVKIAITGGPTWYGICIEELDARDGGQSFNGGAEIITGKQTFVCRGLEYLLHRTPIDTSVVKDANGAAGETTIGRAIAFNLGAGLPSSALRENNASLVEGNAGSWVFASTLTGAAEWDSFQILRYLLKIHAPRGLPIPPAPLGLDKLGWFINEPVVRGMLVGFNPVLHCEGKSFFQVLNELVDRRRLMSWWVYVDPNNEHPEIRIFTFTPNVIVLPDNQFIQANPDQANWDFDQENQVQTCTLATDDSSRYHRVIVKGEPPGGVFTASFTNSLLEIDWTTAQKTAYDAGDATAAAAANEWLGHHYHQSARHKDYLKKVYSYFRISPTAFTGYIGGVAIWPFDNATINTCLSFWWPGLRLQDRLPLRTEHNYTTPAAFTNNQLASSKWEYRRPFAFVTDQSTGRVKRLDTMGRGDVDADLQSAGTFWAASLRMQDDAFGVILDTGGAPQHLIADNTYTSPDATDLSDYQPSVDYNYMSVTVFAEGDGHIQVQWPLAAGFAVAADTLKDQVIYAPHCRLDYIVPGTTWDVGTDGLPLTSVGGFIQDDTAYMLNIARTAYEWYALPRKSLQVTIHELAQTRFIGELVLTIGGAVNAETINSVVTLASYDLLAGTATYLTQFGELDV